MQFCRSCDCIWLIIPIRDPTDLEEHEYSKMENALYQVLKKTMSGDVADLQKATEELTNLERQPGFGPVVLALLANPQFQDVNLAAAISMKNFVRKYWNGDELFEISVKDRIAMRSGLVASLLRCTETQLRKQFAETIILVASSDFPTDWPDMMEMLLGEDFDRQRLHSIVGVFQCLDGVFQRWARGFWLLLISHHRYRHEYKSEDLWSEIAIVLKTFCGVFFDVTQAACGQLNTISELAVDQQRLLVEIVNYSTRMFVSLVTQELAEHFEDNLNVYMECHLGILNFQITPQSDRVVQEYLVESKVSVCEGITLLMHVYPGEFMSFAREFMKCVWTMLISLERDKSELDTLKCSAMHFLAEATAISDLSSHLSDASVLQAICEQIIIPNITIRDHDFEAYEDNPDDFIRRDIENTDNETPRRAACDFIRALCVNMESQVVAVFGQYIEGLLQAFAQNSGDHWRQKDVATFLVICLAKKSHTAKYGVMVSSSLIDLNRFFIETLQSHLVEQNVSYPLLTVDAIKFLTEFRFCLQREIILCNLVNLLRFVGSDSYTLSVYASYALERILAMQLEKKPFFTSEELNPCFGQILDNILKALIDSSTRIENEYAMKAVLGLVRRDDLIDQAYAKTILSKLIEIVNEVAKNPRKPLFNHYTFETLGELLNWYAAKDTLSIPAVYASVHELLVFLVDKPIADFVPYALQIWTLMLSPRANGLGRDSELTSSICNVVKNIDGLLAIGSCCVPALAKLICFLVFYNERVLFPSEAMKILGLVRKTIASKVRDRDGFDILCVCVMKVDIEVMRTYLKEIFAMLFTRLTSAKSKRFMHDFIHFNSHVVLRFGARFTLETVDSLQPDLFRMVCQSVYLAEMSKIRKNQKVIVVATSKILCDQVFAQKYTDLWYPLLEATVNLSLTERDRVVEASIFEDDSEKLEQLMQADDLSHNALKSCPALQYNDHLLHFVGSSGKQQLMKEMSAFLSRSSYDSMQFISADDLNRAQNYLSAKQ